MLLQALASGIALGLIYAGVGAGLSLIVSTGRLTNLAHGEFVLAGGYILYLLCLGFGLPWPVGAPAHRGGRCVFSEPFFPRSSTGCPDGRWTVWR